jgi:hypothetical protein
MESVENSEAPYQFISLFDIEKDRCKMFMQDESILYLLLKQDKMI